MGTCKTTLYSGRCGLHFFITVILFSISIFFFILFRGKNHVVFAQALVGFTVPGLIGGLTNFIHVRLFYKPRLQQVLFMSIMTNTIEDHRMSSRRY